MSRTRYRGNRHRWPATRRDRPRAVPRELTGSNGRADGAALSAVRAGRRKASVIGRDGMARGFWPTVPRRPLFRFDLSVRSYGLVLARDGESENSASVLGSSGWGEAAHAPNLMGGMSAPRGRVSGVKERRTDQPLSPGYRKAGLGLVDRHSKCRCLPVIHQNCCKRCHSLFHIVACGCNAGWKNAK
jgi:hypothetical protein